MDSAPAFVIDRPEIVDAPEMQYVGISHQVTMQQMDQPAQSFPRLFDWLARQGIEPVGPPFYRYLVIDMTHHLTVEAGVPVAVELTSEGDIISGALPAGRYLTVSHTGHPDELEEVTRQLLAFAQAEGLTFDCSPDQRDWTSRLEFYGTDPQEQPDLSQWQTELAFKLAD